MPLKGQPHTGRGAKGIIRPHVWVTGPDPYKHSMYSPWQKAKAQSDYRNRQGLETGKWRLSFDDFYELWKNDWNSRGRGPYDLCLTRINPEKPWTLKNCEIVERIEHLRRQAQLQVGKKRPRKK